MILNEFRTALKTRLGSGYYFGEAPETAAYPYRVGSFTGSYSDEAGETFALELDYWTYGKSISTILDMADTDRGDGQSGSPSGLDRLTFYLPSGTAYMMYDTMNIIEDADKDIRRVRISYSVKFYYRRA